MQIQKEHSIRITRPGNRSPSTPVSSSAPLSQIPGNANQGKVNTIDKAAYQYESSLDGVEETNEQCSEFRDQTNKLYDNMKSQTTSMLSELDPELFEEHSVREKDQSRYSIEEEDKEEEEEGEEEEEEDEEPILPLRRKSLEKQKQLPQSVYNYLVMLYIARSAKYK